MNTRGIYGFKKYIFIDDDIYAIGKPEPIRVTNDNCCFLDGWKIPLETIRKLEYQKRTTIPDFILLEFQDIVDVIKAQPKQKTERGMRKLIVRKYDLDGNIISEYESVSKAAESAGVSRQALMQCFAGKSKQSAGYIWRLTETA